MIAAVVLVVFVLPVIVIVVIVVIVYYTRLRSKNQKSTLKVCENNRTGVGDLQAEYQQVERSQSCAQPFDAIRPRDLSSTVSQESDRRRFLNRGVRRNFARDRTFSFLKTVVDKTITIL